ncbi:S-layer homology domain-containing protein [Patescibacteria group bacterium]|nr:S-layer homology domain-containing protein [Patescibacteria group bacterium]
MRLILSIIIGLLPLSAFALNYDADLPYLDVAPNYAEKVSVGALTDEGILEGNPDGTFKYTRLLNRAEFMKIVMSLVPTFSGDNFQYDCFPDVSADAWFAEPVCRAKQLGIVHGNAVVGVDPQFWFFEPSRSVQYEEAMKVLVNIYDIQTPRYFAAVEWYVPYIHAAEERGLALDLEPGHKLTRGQVSRLVARFVAFDRGELDLLLQAEAGAGGDDPIPTEEGTCEPYACDDGRMIPSCTQDGHAIIYDAHPCDIYPLEGINSCDPIVCNDGRTFASCSDGEPLAFTGGTPCLDESSYDLVTYDLDTDLSATSDFIMLGETSSVLGVAEVFSDTEPLDVTKLTVIFTSASDIGSVESLRIYDEEARYLGRANKDTTAGNFNYVLNMKNGTWVIPKRETRKFYARAVVNGYKSGGDSGDVIEIDSMQVEGDGVWSNKTITKGTSEDYNSFQTARSIITDISNGGSDTDALYSGTDLVLGAYRFEGVTGDGSADLRVTDLTFQLEVNDGVTVANVQMSTDGTSDRMDCTVGVSTVTCSSISEQFGSFKGSARTLTLFGDVTVPNDARLPRLSLSLNQPGSIGSAGSVTWTDGDTAFEWVPFGTPVARGTVHSW